MSLSIVLVVLYHRGIVTIFDNEDIIPLRAFFVWRHYNDHENATVFLLQVKKGFLDDSRITGCGIGQESTSSFELLSLNSNNDHILRFGQSPTHEEAVVLCYDLKLSQPQSRPFITYRNAYEYSLRVEAKSDLVRNNQEARNYYEHPRILVCANMLRGTDWIVKEWIQYQRNIGVDFIHLYTTQLIDLKDSSHTEFLYVDVWQSVMKENGILSHFQSLQSMDCLYRYYGLFDFVLMYDTSDYFAPMMYDKFDIKDYVKVMFNSVHTGSALLRRVIYSINSHHFKDKLQNVKVSNISSILDGQEFKELGLVSKAIHKISATLQVSGQGAISLMPSFVTERISPQVAYIVHIKN